MIGTFTLSPLDLEDRFSYTTDILTLTCCFVALSPASSKTASTSSPSTSLSGIPLRFPYRLHKMLEEAQSEGLDNLITWLPCGTKFKIIQPMEFAERLMPKYCRHTKYKSFLRQLSMYKFQRIPNGLGKNAYYHPHFLRNRLDLAEYINRETILRLPESIMLGSSSSSTGSSGGPSTKLTPISALTNAISPSNSASSFGVSQASYINMVKFNTSNQNNDKCFMDKMERELMMNNMQQNSSWINTNSLLFGATSSPLSPSFIATTYEPAEINMLPPDDIVDEIVNTFCTKNDSF